MLAAGSVFAGYRVEHVLGSGGMGIVYLARHPVLARSDALKVLSTSLSGDPEFRARFMREADLAATLGHPNIVSVYGRGESDDGQLWIAMRYVHGVDADAATKAGTMTPARAVHIATEIGKALDFAHRQHVVHRDVKPANFLLTGDGGAEEQVLLADFGVARPHGDAGLTSTESTLSTLAYSAPEVLTNGHVDGRADLYSLGCSLFRMLTGTAPFSFAPGTAGAVIGHLHHAPPAVTDFAPWLPVGLNAVIATAMAKVPEHRFQSGRDLAAAAAAALRGTDGRVNAIPRRRRRTIVAVAVTVVVAVGAAVAAIALTGRPQPLTPSAVREPNHAAPLPSPPAVAVPALPALLPDAGAVSTIMGAPMELKDTITGLESDANSLDDKTCAGPFAPGQQLVYTGTGWMGSVLQSFEEPPDRGHLVNHHAIQAVIAFPTADIATRFLAAQTPRWQECVGSQVTVATSRDIKVTFGKLISDDTGTLTQTQTLHMFAGWVCTRILGVRANVAIDVAACNPDTATTQATALFDAIAAKIPRQ